MFNGDGDVGALTRRQNGEAQWRAAACRPHLDLSERIGPGRVVGRRPAPAGKVSEHLVGQVGRREGAGARGVRCKVLERRQVLKPGDRGTLDAAE